MMIKLLKRIKVILKKSERKPVDFLFIHINKTGGSSIESALGVNFQHKTAKQKIKEIGIDEWNRKFTFTVVRNPWDKVVSHYHYRLLTKQPSLINKPVSFKEWVALTYGRKDSFYYDQPLMFMPQFDWIVDDEEKLLVDEVMRFENLEQDFRVKVLKKLGLSVTLPHIKKTNRGNYHNYYDDKTAEIVRKWFHRDIEYFNYKY